MKLYAIIAAFFAHIISVGLARFRGGQNERRKAKIKGLQNKVKANEVKDKHENASDDDVTAGLSGWRVPPKQ